MKYICKICGQIIDTNDICPFCGSDSSKIEPYEVDETKSYRCLNCGHELDQNNECPFCGATSNMIFEINNDTTIDDMVEDVNEEKPVFEFCEGDECGEEENECCCCHDHDDGEEHECCCHNHEDEEEHECCCHKHDEQVDEEEQHCCCHSNESANGKITAESFANSHHCDNCTKEECDGTCDDEIEDAECHHEHEDGCCCCGHCDDDNAYYFDDLVQDLLTVYGYLYKNDYAQAKIFAEYLKNFFLEVALDFEKELDVNEALENLENNVYFKDIIKQFN